MTAAEIDAAIARLASLQHGVVRRSQLLRLGISRGVIDRRVRDGRLRPVHRGVYQVGPLAMRRAREMAAVLACGESSVLSHRSAAAMWGITAKQSGRSLPEVSTRTGDHTARPGIRVYRARTLRTDEVTKLDGIPVTTVARTLYDLATTVSRRELEQALAKALDAGLVTRSTLMKQLARRPKRPGTVRLRQLLDSDVPPALTESEAEERFLALIRRSGLPVPETNVTVCGHRVDCYWAPARLVAEIDGRKFHSSKRMFESDRRRDQDLTAAGLRVVRITWTQIVKEPEALLVRLTRALDGDAGPPTVGRRGGRRR